MALFSFIIASLCFLNTAQALVRCNGNVTKLQVCSLVSNYQKSRSGGKPLKLGTSVTVFKIAELDDKAYYEKNTSKGAIQ